MNEYSVELSIRTVIEFDIASDSREKAEEEARKILKDDFKNIVNYNDFCINVWDITKYE